MKINSIYINLPVKDISETRKFWTGLGFEFNEAFSDDKALCMVLNDGQIYSMMLHRDYFQTFTNRPVADASNTQVLMAIQVDSREKVDALVEKALDSGGTRYRQPEDHGWMYYDTFADINGHQWEVMFADESKIPQE